MNDTLKEALFYAAQGMSVIPVGENKVPLVDRRPFISTPADESQIKEWFSEGNASIGICTGECSGVVVIDVDRNANPDFLHSLFTSENTIASKTPHGNHYYYKCPPVQIASRKQIVQGVDFHGNGSFVIAPPSLKKYKWVTNLVSYDFAELPGFILDLITVKTSKG